MGIKVLIDLERLRRPSSGIANVFRNLARGLEKADHPFDITYFGEFSSVDFPLNSKKKWKRLHKIHEFFSSKFDIIHVSHQASLYFNRNYRHSKKVVTLHDLNFLHENLNAKKRNKLITVVNKNLKNADYIVSISEFVKDDFEKNKHLFTLKKLKSTEVIHNGIQLPEQRSYDLGRFKDFEKKDYILNIGILIEKKNQLKLIEMLPFLEQDLVLVSSEQKEPYYSQLKKRIKELKLENRVHFLKNISEEEKYALIQNCESLCHPSIAEGFGIPPIEAMSFGKPVFLSTFTSLPEIGGEYAFYFEEFKAKKMAEFYLEKMQHFHSNKTELESQIKNWTKQFDYTVMSNNYLKLYQKIAAEITS